MSKQRKSIALVAVLTLVVVGLAIVIKKWRDHDDVVRSRTAGLSIDDTFVKIAQAVPGFGGLFIDDDGSLQVYLLDPDKGGDAQRVIAEVLGASRVPADGIQVRQGRYGFLKLKAWHDRHRVSTLALPGVLSTDIRESTNKLQVEVRDATALATVERQMARLRIPREAVDIVEDEPTQLLQTLQDFRRPLTAGVQISNGGGLCTLGLLAARQNEAGFVTNSHCTAIQGGVEDTLFFQDVADPANRIGIESVDPQYFTDDDCPSGRRCRFSDSAFVRRSSGTNPSPPPPDAEFGYIASAAEFDITIAHKFRIASQVAVSLEGERLTKVGRTTGQTDGKVYETCLDINAFQDGQDSGITLLCQSRVVASSAPGDSGSPVFTWSSATLPPGGIPPASLAGLSWGGNALHFSFSPIWAIELELGTLKTYPEEAGPNSDPEVKILTPVDGSTVGLGGLNMVQFTGAIVDYEHDIVQTSWTSDVDGPLSATYTFDSPGERTITFTATDSLGNDFSDKIQVSAGVNTAPTVTIAQPPVGTKVFKGFTMVISGESYDPNEPLFTLPCGSLVWTSSTAGDPFPATGCSVQLSFATIGTRTITLTGTDSHGGKGTASVAIVVQNPPVNAPPVVTILHPLEGSAIDAGTPVDLRAAVQDPDGKSPIAYTWLLEYDGIDKVLGTGAVNSGSIGSLKWTPHDDVPSKCGSRTVMLRLTAKDADASTSAAAVETEVHFGPC